MPLGKCIVQKLEQIYIALYCNFNVLLNKINFKTIHILNNVFISRYWYTSDFCGSSRLVVWSIHMFVSFFMDSSYQLTENQKVPLWWFHLVWGCFWPEQLPQILYYKFCTKMVEFIWSSGHCTSLVTLHHVTTWIRRNKGCFPGFFDESCQDHGSKSQKA